MKSKKKSYKVYAQFKFNCEPHLRKKALASFSDFQGISPCGEFRYKSTGKIKLSKKPKRKVCSINFWRGP